MFWPGTVAPSLVVVSSWNRQGSPGAVFTQLPAGRTPATAITPVQLAGVPTASPSLPAEATISTPCAVTSLTVVAYMLLQAPLLPRLRLMICAGVGFTGRSVRSSSAGGRVRPADQYIAAITSESNPPHLPSARAGSTRMLKPVPAMPTPLSVFAATMPDTRVPCQLLAVGWSLPGPAPHPLPLKVSVSRSCADRKSPASEASGSQLSPSPAIVGELMKS